MADSLSLFDEADKYQNPGYWANYTVRINQSTDEQ